MEQVREHFLNPQNVGELESPAGVGRSGSMVCGAIMITSLQVNAEQLVTEAKFKATGCSYLIAAGSLLTDLILNKPTAEAANLAQNGVFLEPPPDKKHCVEVAREAILSAIRHYSDSVRAEWPGEDALICTCFGVSEQRIEDEIRTKSLGTVDEVTRACNAGAGCGSCYKLIEEILKVAHG